LATTKKRTTDLKQEGALNDCIIESMRDVKAKQILKLDLRKVQDAPAGWFVICEGDSITQVRGICGRIEDNVHKEHALKPWHVEGRDFGKWVLMDYGSTIVHVFYKETRDFYDLEGLWNDAKVTEFADV
jgi:ribosome-associated protein